jgi:hypothetical protein
MALSLRSSAAFQQSLDGAFTAFKRSQNKYHYIRMALSLRSSATSRIGLTQSPLKTSAELFLKYSLY